VRGIKTKLTELRQSIPIHDYSVFLLSETWLDGNVGDSEMGFNSHTIYRKDRSKQTSVKSRGGGVLIAINKKFKSTLVKTNHKNLEQIYIKVKLKNESIIIGIIYIPPSSPIMVYKDFCEDLENLQQKFPSTVFIIAGDFNLPNIKWPQDPEEFPINVDNNEGAMEVLETIQYLNMMQYNYIFNSRNRLLDLILSNKTDICVQRSIEDLLPVDPYHPPLTMKITSEHAVLRETSTFSYNFKKGDYPGAIEYLIQAEWTFLQDNDINRIVQTFYKILHDTINKFVPYEEFRSTNYPSWFTSDLIRLIRDKKMAHKRFKESLKREDQVEFNRIRAECNELKRSCYKEFINKAEN
jgi:hypothetical protein